MHYIISMNIKLLQKMVALLYFSHGVKPILLMFLDYTYFYLNRRICHFSGLFGSFCLFICNSFTTIITSVKNVRTFLGHINVFFLQSFIWLLTWERIYNN